MIIYLSPRWYIMTLLDRVVVLVLKRSLLSSRLVRSIRYLLLSRLIVFISSSTNILGLFLEAKNP